MLLLSVKLLYACVPLDISTLVFVGWTGVNSVMGCVG